MMTVPEVVVEEAALPSTGENGHGKTGLPAAPHGGKSSRTGSESSQSGHQGETADEGSNESLCHFFY